ncbi:MAG: hypothetical protein Q7S79_02805 [bacterium]|nr:hypothetical protein [bacterium]
MAVARSETEVKRRREISVGVERARYFYELEGRDEPAYWFAEEMLRQIAENAHDGRGLCVGVVGLQAEEYPDPIGKVDWTMRVGFVDRSELERDWHSKGLVWGLQRSLGRNPIYKLTVFPSTPVTDSRVAVDRHVLLPHTEALPVRQVRTRARVVDYTRNENPCIVINCELGGIISPKRGLISIAGPNEKLFGDLLSDWSKSGDNYSILYRPTGR